MRDFPVLNFQAFISDDSGRLTTDSRKVALVFGKRHDHVLRAIQTIIANCPPEFAALNFGECFRINELANGKSEPYYVMTRDGFALLAMGFTGKKALAFKIAYIDAFNRMEAFVKYQQNSLVYRHFELQLEHRSEKAKASLCGRGLVKWKGKKPVIETEMKSIEDQMNPGLALLH